MVLEEKPLVVDLDGSLLKTDLLYESVNQFFALFPLQFWKILLWAFRGKAYLKKQLALRIKLNSSLLPYNQGVLNWLFEQKAAGRDLILATASHEILARSVANHLNIFTEVIATKNTINLRGEVKKIALCNKFGSKGFDYLGDSMIDIPVWKEANNSYAVTNSQRLNKTLKKFPAIKIKTIFPNERPNFLVSLIKTLRIHQWIKNLLIFIPIIAAHRLFDHLGLMQAVLAFIAFSLCASAVYILNDLLDVENDRNHLRKRLRVFAAGNLSLLIGWLLWPIFIISAIFLSLFTLPFMFLVVLGLYFFITLAYSFRLKRVVILDVLILATLYTLRIIAGAIATNVPISFWLLTFSLFIFLSLAFVKRFGELKSSASINPEGAIYGRGYTTEDGEMVATMGLASGYLSVLVLALYIQDSNTAVLYRAPQIIWMACPVMLYWISRTWLITHRGLMHDDPIIFAVKDKVSWAVAICFIFIFILASF